jgi:hypothetical protein
MLVLRGLSSFEVGSSKHLASFVVRKVVLNGLMNLYLGPSNDKGLLLRQLTISSETRHLMLVERDKSLKHLDTKSFTRLFQNFGMRKPRSNR